MSEPLLFITPLISLWGQGESGEPQDGGRVSVGGVGVPFPPCLSVNVRKRLPFISLLYTVVAQKG